MKRLSLVLAALFIAAGSFADDIVWMNPPASSGITSGSATSGCTASTLIWSNGSNNVACGATATPSGTTALRLGDGTSAAPAYAFGTNTGTGMYETGIGVLGFSVLGTSHVTLDNGNFTLGSGYNLAWGGSGIAVTNLSAGRLGFSSANQSFQNTGLSSRVAADVTNATTTFAAATGLSAALVTSGAHYAGRATLKVNDSVAADGIKLDANNGSATMSDFSMACHQDVGGTVVLVAAISTSLAGVVNFSTITGETVINCDIQFTPSSSSTFGLRQAQNAHTSGTLTIEKGSFMLLDDVP